MPQAAYIQGPKNEVGRALLEASAVIRSFQQEAQNNKLLDLEIQKTQSQLEIDKIRGQVMQEELGQLKTHGKYVEPTEQANLANLQMQPKATAANIGLTEAETGLTGERREGMFADRQRQNEMNPYVLSLAQQNAKGAELQNRGAAFQLEKGYTDHVNALQDRMNSQKGITAFGEGLAMQNPNLDKKWIEHNALALGMQGMSKLNEVQQNTAQLQQDNKMKMEHLTLLKEGSERENQQQRLVMLDKLSTSPFFAQVAMNDPSMFNDPAVAAAAQLHQKFSTARGIDASIEAGISSSDREAQKAAALLMFVKEGAKIPMKDTGKEDLSGNPIKEPDYDGMMNKAMPAFDALQSQRKEREKMMGQPAEGTPVVKGVKEKKKKPAQAAAGDSQENPIPIAKKEDYSNVPVGKWYRTPSGKVLLKQAT